LRFMKTLVAAAAAAATVVALSAPALADPTNPKTGKAETPAQFDIVGVGSETIAYVSNQLAHNYDLANKHNTPSTPDIFSWDGTPASNPGDTNPQTVVLKTGCKEVRPDGSSAGISALEAPGIVKYKGTKYPCINFARSSRGRNSTTAPIDSPCSKGGICFVILANDVVTYATTSGSNAPNNLTKNELAEIFGCSIPAAHGFGKGTWGALLGSKAKDPTGKPDPLLPQSGSGTLKFWAETALGLPGDDEPACGSLAGVTSVSKQPEENEGISKAFLLKNGKPNPNVIYPFSIASYIAQSVHSAKLGHKPGKGQNLYGFNETGVFHLNGIAGVAPTMKKGGQVVINNAWNRTVFRRYVYDVVPFSSARGNVNHIAPNLVKFFGPKGYWCTHTSVLSAYGFEPTEFCGSSS
jgi:ABC-type phosphate transport system substrate-binding protein